MDARRSHSEAELPLVQVLVTDLDNTLWDWVHLWARSMRQLLGALAEQSGVPIAVLSAEAKSIHERRGTVEYSLLVDELPSLKGVTPASSRFDAAVHAQHSARKEATRLYPGVAATLSRLKSSGVKLIAYSESLEFWTERRIRRTGLDGVIDVLYTSEDHVVPDGFSFESVRTLPPGDYGLEYTDHRVVAKGLHKPNPDVLLSIVEESGVDRKNLAYVGDSRSKDVAMAQTAGVQDVWAAYGSSPDPADLELLSALTHWTPEMIRDDRLARASSPSPTFILKNGFDELTSLFRFEGRESTDGPYAVSH
jgi:phosphoglycolate phosphatase